MKIAALSVFSVVAAMTSATELRGSTDRKLSGYETIDLKVCGRVVLNVFVGPIVPEDTKIEVRRVNDKSDTLTIIADDQSKGVEVTGHSYFKISEEDKKWFESAGKVQMRAEGSSTWKTCIRNTNTPIGLDVDGSGSVERINGNFFIDISGDGDIEHLHEWFAPTEGILIDAALATKDGVISTEHFAGSRVVANSRELKKHSGAITGKHLFGDMGSLFSDGFEKLSVHDGNKDGSVMGTELKGLAVWVDANSNAKVDVGELNTLAHYGIVGLDTDHENYISSAMLMDGSTMVTEDLWFSR